MNKLLIRLDMKPDETWVTQEALERYRKHCEQEIAIRQAWPYMRLIKSLRKTETEIEDTLREVGDKDTFGVTLNLDPDGIMTLTEALTRFLVQCEQDDDNKKMPPLGSRKNGGLILLVRENLNRQLRRTWKILPAVKRKRSGLCLVPNTPR